MDERANGVMETSKRSPAAEARELEEEVDTIRDELGDLVGELDRRRHRATTPLLIGAAAVVASTTVVAGVLLWRQASARRRLTAMGYVRDLLFGKT